MARVKPVVQEVTVGSPLTFDMTENPVPLVDTAPPRAHTDEVIAAAFLDADQLVSGERVVAPGLSIVRGIRNVYVNFDGIVAVLPIRIP